MERPAFALRAFKAGSLVAVLCCSIPMPCCSFSSIAENTLKRHLHHVVGERIHRQAPADQLDCASGPALGTERQIVARTTSSRSALTIAALISDSQLFARLPVIKRRVLHLSPSDKFAPPTAARGCPRSGPARCASAWPSDIAKLTMRSKRSLSMSAITEQPALDRPTFGPPGPGVGKSRRCTRFIACAKACGAMSRSMDEVSVVRSRARPQTLPPNLRKRRGNESNDGKFRCQSRLESRTALFARSPRPAPPPSSSLPCSLP